MYHVPLAVQCIYEWSDDGDGKEGRGVNFLEDGKERRGVNFLEDGKEGRGVNFLEDGREWRLLGLLYADNLVQCGELEEDLRVMVLQCVGGDD